MARTIITHVGASALECEAMGGVQIPFKDLVARLRKERDRPNDLALCLRELRLGLEREWATYDRRVACERSPAEIASLSLLELKPEDRVVLLHPATAGGRFCAALIKEALAIPITAEGYPRAATVKPLEVPQLRVSGDSRTEVEADNSYRRFVREGVVNYVRAIWDIYTSLKPTETLVFNVTGGYRGMLPIARDLTMLLSAHSHGRGERLPVTIKMCILFKSGDDLVHYDALPVSFTWRKRMVNDLELAGGDLGVDSRQLHLSEHPEWRAFFEDVKGQPGRTRRSPLGEVVLALAERLDPGELADEA